MFILDVYSHCDMVILDFVVFFCRMNEIIDMSEEANERNRLSRKRKPYGTRRNSDSAPQKSYKWTWDL